jgi:hypothetical protein
MPPKTVATEGRRKGAPKGAPESREIHRGPKDERNKTHTLTPFFSRRRDLARSAKVPVPHTEGHWFDSQKNIYKKKKKKKEFGESWTFTSPPPRKMQHKHKTCNAEYAP